jgi:ribosomal protein S18 acetylase RimI-like enzyme
MGSEQLIDAPGASEIKSMAVEPGQRGRGVGRMLVDEAAARAR